MKLIQINASYKPAFIYGGPTMSVSKLSEVLVAQGVDVNVLTTGANGDQDFDIIPGKTVHVDHVPVTYYKRLTRDHTHFSPGLYWGLWKRLNGDRQRMSREQDRIGANVVVHIHAWWNLVSVFSCLIAILKGVAVILSPRGTLSSYSFGNKNTFLKNIIFKLSEPLLNRCHFHVTSENEKRAIFALLNPRSIRIIPNLVSLPEAEKQKAGAKRQDAKFKILFLSRIEEKKGIELLFSALAQLDLNYHLTIAGNGDSRYIERLKNLSASFRLDNRISWIGQQSAEIKFDVMAAHDLMVLPSYDENFANVVVESLAVGTAVLVTENVGLSDYVREKDFGWVSKFDEGDLKELLIAASSDVEKLKRIRKDAPASIREDYSDEVLGGRYIDLYRNVIDDRLKDGIGRAY